MEEQIKSYFEDTPFEAIQKCTTDGEYLAEVRGAGYEQVEFVSDKVKTDEFIRKIIHDIPIFINTNGKQITF